MNHWNPWETTLRSWTPRRPSSRLEAKIFEREASPETRKKHGAACRSKSASESSPRWSGLAPALAVFMLFAFVAGQRVEVSSAAGALPAMRQLIGGNGSDVASLDHWGSSMHSPHNNLQKATFEWTNESPSLTTSPPFSGTNSLFH